jgi:hypothetical protein
MFFKLLQKAIFIISFTGSCIIAHEPLNKQTWLTGIIGAIGQSTIIHLCSEHIQTRIDKVTSSQIMNLGDEPASQKYQELGSQAQFAVGIPLERHAPIKKINPASPVAYMFGALAESDAIYVNEEKFDKATYGSVRCALCHEAVHVKYHDKVADGILEIVALIGATIGAFLILKTYDIVRLRKTLSFIIGLGISSCASLQYHQFMERRADIEGHYATQCSTCVYEHAQRRKQLFEEENNPLKDHGYLWAADLEKIAQELGDKKCAYHSHEQL